MAADKIDTIVSLSKRRGFVYPCSEIYGGQRAAWDYGPLGVELKENIKRQWWRAMVTSRDDIVGIDSSVILAPQVWEASGHVATFTDPLTECTSCHKRFRADHLEEAYEAKHGRLPAQGLADVNCPHCGNKGGFTEPKQFSGLLSTFLGPVQDEGSRTYLRPETAQGIFTNFASVQQTSRKKPPFGIAQTGKSFRNEITPGNFIFRTREFEQMEMEFFVKPGEDESWHDYWMQQRWSWYTDLGLSEENMRWYEHPQEKLSHYSKRTADIEYRFNFGGSEFSELEGVANRTDFDLTAHSKASGQDLSYFDQEAGERWVPYVIEPAAGVNRAMLAFMLDAYIEDEAPNAKGKLEKRNVMRLDPRLAPVKVAVLPLSRNEKLSPKARGLAETLRKHWNIEFDDAGAIGRRYRRQDEIGTPFCVTVDFDTLDDNAVTVRERDTMKQDRVSLDQMENYLAGRLLGC
ncbi:glycyl-tRNA synthetase [Streptomyces sp. Amel2xB2]|uniref:Glycine--tRNA ligase n=1 Tax=Streptomyces nanshensis TaxID=518642 RepID=A0A1E7KYX0_9ACTN|nr:MULTISPECIES: glycine--tRNA ligase [Streptomyces]OEV09105.1 glycine--tRNA ligase [Streptomyces nanshensis]RAJ70082.1 glycyl-tRNA synthetase [Streptomyces sp. Amel2xB2]